jgi:hypothetical protein
MPANDRTRVNVMAVGRREAGSFSAEKIRRVEPDVAANVK